jgi:hypothetical protein
MTIIRLVLPVESFGPRTSTNILYRRYQNTISHLLTVTPILHQIVIEFIFYRLLKYGVDWPSGYREMANSRWAYRRGRCHGVVVFVLCQKSCCRTTLSQVSEIAISIKLGTICLATYIYHFTCRRTEPRWVEMVRFIGFADRRSTDRHYVLCLTVNGQTGACRRPDETESSHRARS